MTTAAAEQTPKALLVFDMPYGECRLTIMSDGSALLSYGALPQQTEIRAGSFEPAGLEKTFRAISDPSDDARHRLSPPVGSVQFVGNEALSWFNDEGFASTLLKRGWNNRLPGDEADVVAKACGSK
jgi:hypothetical protein